MQWTCVPSGFCLGKHWNLDRTTQRKYVLYTLLQNYVHLREFALTHVILASGARGRGVRAAVSYIVFGEIIPRIPVFQSVVLLSKTTLFPPKACPGLCPSTSSPISHHYKMSFPVCLPGYEPSPNLLSEMRRHAAPHSDFACMRKSE